MKRLFSIIPWITLLLFQLLLILVFKNNTNWVESYYTNLFYYYSSASLRYSFGFLSISVGDIIYALAISYLLFKLYEVLKSRKTYNVKTLKLVVLSLKSALLFFLVFNILWGLNNYRIPLHERLQIDTQYSQDDLYAITGQLIEKANKLQLQIMNDSTVAVKVDYTTSKILHDAEQGINLLNKDLNWKEFKNTSIKQSLWSLPLTYMGFSGYINPFTNEAQVNYKIPKIGMIVTASHETAHQMGIAKESEANLIGYLSTLKQEDVKYQYAAIIYALRYCLTTIERGNYPNISLFTDKINSGVLLNLSENQKFWKQYKGPSSAFFKIFYGNFLKATNQKEGIYSYNRFVDLLINYHKTKPIKI